MDFICKSLCESFFSLLFPPFPHFKFVSWLHIQKERNKYAFFTSCTHTYQQLIKNGTGQSKKILDSCWYNLLLIKRRKNIQQHLFSEDAIQHLPISSARIWVLAGPTELRWAEGFPGVLSSLQDQSSAARRQEQSAVLSRRHRRGSAIKQSHWIKSGLSLQPSAVMVLACPYAGNRLYAEKSALST